jgi:hypothetical protein
MGPPFRPRRVAGLTFAATGEKNGSDISFPIHPEVP